MPAPAVLNASTCLNFYLNNSAKKKISVARECCQAKCVTMAILHHEIDFHNRTGACTSARIQIIPLCKARRRGRRWWKAG